jgi:hypothetical protein
MLAFYKSKGALVEIDASMPEAEVFSALEKVIG